MKKFLAFFMLICIALTGCNYNKFVDPYNEMVQELSCTNNDNKILYHLYKQRFLSYNTNTHKIDYINDLDNYYQYNFNTKSKYYTTGHSIKSHFKLVKLEDNSILNIFESDDPLHFGVFPLAENDEKHFFTKWLYDDNGLEIPNTRKVVYLDESNKLVELNNINDDVMGGAIIDNYLYYTAYVNEKNNYSLYKIDILNNSSKPIHLEDNLGSEELFNYKGKLYKSNREEIYCDEEPENRFKFCSYNYFDNENDVLIQIRVNENADLALSVTDITTKEILGEFISPINFDISENKLTVYCIGNIYHLDL